MLRINFFNSHLAMEAMILLKESHRYSNGIICVFTLLQNTF